MNLTKFEKMAMSVKYTDYGIVENGEPTWSFAWMDKTGIPTKQLRGVMSSLEQKGLICIEGTGDDAIIYYTKEGLKICKSL